jgi:hypothetical protein
MTGAAEMTTRERDPEPIGSSAEAPRESEER